MKGVRLEAGKTGTVGTAQLAAAFVALVVTTSSMEAAWYLRLAEDTYAAQIGPLMKPQFDVFVAALFYLCYSLGATVFSVRPALLARSWSQAAGLGALYGFSCFSAHNLTDLADVKGYTSQIALIDICWGTCMTSLACVLSYLLGRRVLRQP
jgi:uncharacterized membrane protein